jgi:protein-disulfide isomerase
LSIPGAKGPTKNEKREHAREQARIFREKQQKQQKRRRLFIQGGVGIAVIAVIAIIALVVVSNQHAAAVKAASSTSYGPKNMISDGLLSKGSNGKIVAVKTAAIKPKGKPVPTDQSKLTGTANIVEYIDFQCPYCEQFETTNLDAIDKWVAAGKATVEIHPIAFLDSSSQGKRYSSRAANASACVANFDPNDFLPVVKALYKNQPAEGTTGLTNAKIDTILAGAGASSTKVAACVNGESFKSWVTASTARATQDVFKGQVSTPTVFVNGAQYPGVLTDPATFAAFVNQQVPGAAS